MCFHKKRSYALKLGYHNFYNQLYLPKVPYHRAEIKQMGKIVMDFCWNSFKKTIWSSSMSMKVQRKNFILHWYLLNKKGLTIYGIWWHVLWTYVTIIIRISFVADNLHKTISILDDHILCGLCFSFLWFVKACIF